MEQFIPELIDLHQKGRFPIDKLCKVYSVKDLEQALSDMHDGKVRKQCNHPLREICHAHRETLAGPETDH